MQPLFCCIPDLHFQSFLSLPSSSIPWSPPCSLSPLSSTWLFLHIPTRFPQPTNRLAQLLHFQCVKHVLVMSFITDFSLLNSIGAIFCIVCYLITWEVSSEFLTLIWLSLERCCLSASAEAKCLNPCCFCHNCTSPTPLLLPQSYRLLVRKVLFTAKVAERALLQLWQ